MHPLFMPMFLLHPWVLYKRHVTPPPLNACPKIYSKEQRCKSQALLDYHKSDPISSHTASVFVAKDKMDLTKIQCFHYKEIGRYANNYKG